MAKTKISEFSSTPGNNTDIDNINIAEGCAPSGINNAIRELMAQLKDFQAGTAGDSFNGPIGTTTAAAGAFTTLAASGAVTLSGGTANGVAYLNGSKVLTTGSALMFDGTNIGVNNGASLTAAGATVLYMDANQTVMRGRATNGIIFQDSTGAEGMRLTSTGLGIGTSSPSAKLHVSGTGTVTQKLATTSGAVELQLIANSQSNASYSNIYSGDGTNWNWAIGGSNGTSNTMTFLTGGAERARIDSSGNLGLGVTPTNNTLGKTLQNGQAGAWTAESGTNRWWLGSNWYFNSGDKYINNGFASLYSQQNGTHQWLTAPSGTAGNAISFTQTMSLTAAGEFLLGMTSGSTNVPGTLIARLSANVGAIRNVKTATGTYESLQNYHNGSYVGGITYSDTATALVTSSDYRLKNITGPITTSGAYIDSLNPVEGTWKADGSVFVGLIAHEVQEVSKTFVTTGTKDGEKMQGMTYSSPEMIANLIAEVKSLRQRVATLEAQ